MLTMLLHGNDDVSDFHVLMKKLIATYYTDITTRTVCHASFSLDNGRGHKHSEHKAQMQHRTKHETGAGDRQESYSGST